MHSSRKLSSLLLNLVALSLFGTATCARAQATPSQPLDGAKQQSAHTIPEFEVVSIRQIPPQEVASNGVIMRTSSFEFTDDGFRATNAPFIVLLNWAYNAQNFDRIKGLPDWAEGRDFSFDIKAKVGEADIPAFKKLSYDEWSAMLRKMFVDRFHLVAHQETKDGSVYAIVVAKGGPKLKETQPDPSTSKTGRPSMMPGQYSIKEQGGTIDALAMSLEGRLRRPVINKTGLAGKYDYVLDWKPDDPSAPQATVQPQSFPRSKSNLVWCWSPHTLPWNISISTISRSPPTTDAQSKTASRSSPFVLNAKNLSS